MHYSTLLFKLLIFSILPTISFAQNEWELKKDSDGISVWWRATEGTDIKELKIQLEVNASLNTIAAVLSDVPKYEEWVYSTEKSVVVEQNGTDLVYYNIMDFPWPMDDRDLVMLTDLKQDSLTKIITSNSTAVPEKVPYDDDMVRVEMTETQWIVTPLGNNRAKIDYTLISDPGGSIPAFLTNIAADYGPYKTMKAFRERVQRSEYKDAQVEGIEELVEKL
jgi:ribosome-associated toxin RatA of RatAB toxin-antitoxin module